MNNDSPSQLLVYSSLRLQSNLIVYKAAFNLIEIKQILFLRAPYFLVRLCKGGIS